VILLTVNARYLPEASSGGSPVIEPVTMSTQRPEASRSWLTAPKSSPPVASGEGVTRKSLAEMRPYVVGRTARWSSVGVRCQQTLADVDWLPVPPDPPA
jgi:hypothetical protein